MLQGSRDPLVLQAGTLPKLDAGGNDRSLFSRGSVGFASALGTSLNFMMTRSHSKKLVLKNYEVPERPRLERPI